MKSDEVAIEVCAGASLPTPRDLFAVVFRQRRIVLIAFALVVIAAAVSGLWIPKYEAQMKILVRRPHARRTSETRRLA